MSGLEKLAEELERGLLDRHGPMLASRSLWRVLGYSSSDAWRQSITRGTVPVPIFKIEGRAGYFALARDIAAWMAQQRTKIELVGTSLADSREEKGEERAE